MFEQEKKGLSPKDHGILNVDTSVFPGGKEARDKKIAELRLQHEGDFTAQQDIDLYEDDNEYYQKIRKYRNAIKTNNTKEIKELEVWFKENYPDI